MKYILFFALNLALLSPLFSQSSDVDNIGVTLDGDTINMTKAIAKFKSQAGTMASYFRQIGFTDQGLPILQGKKYPKPLIDAPTLESRFFKNKLFEDENAVGHVQKYFPALGEDNRNAIVFFMFKECGPCKKDLPLLEELLIDKFKDYTFLILTFSEPDDINLIMKEYDINYSIEQISKEELKSIFNIHSYPTYLVFNQSSSKLIYEFNSLKNTDISKLDF